MLEKKAQYLDESRVSTMFHYPYLYWCWHKWFFFYNNVSPPSVVGDLSRLLAIIFRPFGFFGPKDFQMCWLSNLLILSVPGWRLFQKLVVRTKLDIYGFLSTFFVYIRVDRRCRPCVPPNCVCCNKPWPSYRPFDPQNKELANNFCNLIFRNCLNMLTVINFPNQSIVPCQQVFMWQ